MGSATVFQYRMEKKGVIEWSMTLNYCMMRLEQ